MKNGGRCIPLGEAFEDIDEQKLAQLTHIVSTHIDFPQYSAALEHGIHIVKPSWVLSSANKNKQAQPRQHSPDPSQFFHNVVLTCADLPEGDKDAIMAGVIALGGQYSGALSKLVTHIVTIGEDNDKCRLAQEKQLRCKIVLPHWFDDCFRLGRMISERPYMFPDPELLRTDNITRVKDFPSPHLDGAISAAPTGPPESTPPPSPTALRKNLNALMRKKVLLSNDLDLSEHLKHAILGLIDHAGGTVITDVDQCDIYIGHYSDGEDYITASRVGKIVANLSWLYHVLNRNKYSNPLSKLLHYPVPRNGLRGFENMKISISNYSGDARIYLENLIKHCGAEFTKTMKQDNTHLITAHTQSEKCEAAQEWGINIINHIWLEESYAKCAVQTLTNPRYTHFPARTNLGEVTGLTSFDMKRVEQMYFPRPRESPQKSTQAPGNSATTKASPKKTAGSKASASAANGVVTADTDVIVANDDSDLPQPSTTKKPRGRPPKAISTPGFRDDEKENESPIIQSGGRAAKAVAASRMSDQMPDMLLFQKEMKRKGGVTHGGRRSDHADDFSSPAAPKQRKKRTSDEASFEVSAEGSELSDGETQAQAQARAATGHPAKKAKNAPAPTNLPPVRYKLLVSGDERWLGNKLQEDTDRSKLRQLGIALVADPKHVDILVAPKILRTRKFVCALASGPTVVNTDWLDSALQADTLNNDFPWLEDPEGEERFGFTLGGAVARAQVNNYRLFRGWSIFVTREVTGGFDTYKDIIEINGGKALAYAGRTGLALPKRRLRYEDDENAGVESQHQGGEDEFDHVYLVSGTSEAEVKLWKTFASLAQKQGLNGRIVKTDWLLHAAMSQRVEWRDDFLVER